MSATLLIERLGAQGDGIARTATGEVFVPFTLPGERVTAASNGKRADLVAVLEPSPERVAPPCRHFGVCGGCALQHVDDATYRTWKRDRVVEALAARGIEASVEPLVACRPYSRRRASFAALATADGVVFGFNQALSDRIVDIAECHIVLPGIMDRLGMLHGLAAAMATGSKPFRMLVTVTTSGLDIAVEGSGTLSGADRQRAVAFALANGLARLALDGEILVEPRKPMVEVGATAVEPPVGAFLQAVAEAEDAMAARVTAHLAKAKRVADLFAGVGAFALRLASRSDVHAVEGDAAALSALDRAWRHASGLRRVTVEKRDLFRRPLTFKELGAFDGVVFDPPRAGAEDQSRQLAKSDVPKVAAVSCNPATLARDLRILLDGGYRLVSVTPVDQFVWSPHVEAVALLEKPRKRR